MTKITSIVQQKNKIFTVQYTPSKLAQFFGAKVYLEHYKQLEDDVYANKCDINIYINKKGEIMPYNSDIVKALENWKRRF